jgi:serine protease Do
MTLKRTLLFSLAFLLISYGGAIAQDTPAPPVVPEAPEAPEAPMEFTYFIGGGSFLGIHPEEVTRDNIGRLGLREVRGVAISKVIAGSPAEKAGLKKDDVILRFNGEEVASVRKLNRMINEVAPDHTVRLTISRNGVEQDVSATVAKRKDFNTLMAPGEMGKYFEDLKRSPGGYALAFGSTRRIGVSTSALTKQLADYFGVAGEKGVLVTSVGDNSPAAKAGLKAGDVITDVDGEKISEDGDLFKAINRKNEGDITLTIVRDKTTRTIRVTPEKREATPMVSPEFDIQVAPRVGVLTLPEVRFAPKFKTIVMPRIEVTPKIKALLDSRALQELHS